MFNQANGFNTALPTQSLPFEIDSLMDLDDMVSQIQLRLGNRKDLREEIIREIKLAQYELERDVTFNPYFLWRAKDLCLKPNCVSYPVPSGFIRLCEINNPLLHVDSTPRAYELNRGIAGITYPKDMSEGRPTSFSIQGNTLRLDARASGVLRLFYISDTVSLSETTKKNWWTAKAYNLLMNKAGLSLAGILRDDIAVQFFGMEYATSLQKFKKECVAFEDFGFSLARAEGLYVGLIKDIGGWYTPPLVG